MPQNNNDFKHNLKSDFKSSLDHDLGDLLDNAVQFGTGVGATVLGSLSDALAQAGDAISAARGAPPDSFAAWKRRLDSKLKNGGYSAGIALTAVGWTFTGIFGITALVMGILWGVGPAALGVSDAAFRVFPILFFCSYPAMLGFLYMAVAGMRKLFYFSRLRKLLRAARDWQCDLPSLARTALLKQEQVCKDVQKAVADGDFPGAAYSADFSTLYFDDTLYHPVEAPAPAESPAPAEPLSEPEQFRCECEAFFAYLQSCRGCLGRDTDTELDAMQKTCRAMLDFVAAHPEQLPQLRRLRDYYLPTTRKLLDTALGLGDDTGSAADIRRDITAILHTLNLAYTKLYDTLLEDVSLDVSTEIDTLEAMLRQDGLTHDFESDFTTRSQPK